MCGIVASFHGGSIENTESMVRQLHHRGPDGSGVHLLPQGILGHTRLAILDPERGHQPYSWQGPSLTYNGELYNFRQLARNYLGHVQFDSHGDTEVLFHLLDTFWESAIPLLDGMFAFVMFRGDSFIAARDPLGIKPLFFCQHEDEWHFASEIKVLLPLNYPIREFPAGWYLDSLTGWHQYFSLKDSIVAFEGTKNHAHQLIRDILGRAVEKRLVSDVPLGVSLSGGLDSSIIAALARPHSEVLHTFTTGMKHGPDIPAAQHMADFLGTTHKVRVYTDKDMIKVLEPIIHHLESFDPALVRSAVPNWFLAELASEHVKVMLTGEGADELYAGYDYLGSIDDSLVLQKELEYTTTALHNTNLQRTDRMSMAFGLEARVPFLGLESVRFALGLPAEWKTHDSGSPKQLLRDAFSGIVPSEICNRPKLKFSAGAGSSTILRDHAENMVTDHDFTSEQRRLKQDWLFELTCKESLLYYRILTERLSDEDIFPNMGLSRSL